jgi:SNF2 family DNA or RNA helicase
MGDDGDDDLLFGGSRPVQPGTYAGYEDRDLYQRRFAEIQNYDPAKTTEEINTLLENIRPDEDMPAHLRVQTPEAMTIKLHKYQELGLTWLQKCEDGSNKGGVLADDMGLGKTIQMLSLLVTHKSEDPRCKTTLIVAPVALMRQWQQEIEQKIKPSAYHRLTVFVHHGQGKKKSFKELQHFDIVLTTYGSLAAELKKLEKFQLRKKEFPETRPNNSERCALISDDASWYRVILDEAQCIKNTNTQTSKAACRLRTTYRFCMTGTPMMNNVEEFYSLVKFLRIRPYSEWQKFRLDIASPLKQGGGKDRAMQKLQALCKAVMLRRTKQSKFEGQPILILPERTTEVDNPVFSDDEAEFYKAVEQKTKLQFNRYLKAGTVGSSYSAILVLLLRLRQACCHPHLLKDFGVAAAAGMTPDQLTDLAKELAPPVVDRIKSTGGNFECPVCYDAVVNPAIFLPCGHDTCRECFAKIADPSNAIRDGNETAAGAKCPTCRAPVDPKRITDFDSFKKIYMPNLLSAEEQDELKKFQADMEAAQESGSDSDTDSDEEDDDDDDEVDAKGNLADFVVNDDEEEFETASAADHDDTEADPSTKSSKSKGKQKMKAKPKKAKGKKREKKLKKKELKSVTLAEMKRLATRNAKAKKAYMRRLREDWMTSAKIEKTMDLLREIMRDTDEKVLIFSQWTSFLDLLEVPIDGEHWGYRRYDGSMNAQMRNDAVDDFRDHRGNVRIMLVSLKAGNAGLNLNMASQVIILDPFWNPYIEEQAIDRSHRLGQTRPVKVHRMLIEGTVEDRIIALQEKKRAIISEALDENASKNIARLGVQELAYLFGVTRNASQRIEYVPRERH